MKTKASFFCRRVQMEPMKASLRYRVDYVISLQFNHKDLQRMVPCMHDVYVHYEITVRIDASVDTASRHDLEDCCEVSGKLQVHNPSLSICAR